MAKIYAVDKNHTQLLSLEANLRARHLDVVADDVSDSLEHSIGKMQIMTPDYLLFRMDKDEFKRIINRIKESEGLVGIPVFYLSEKDPALEHLVDYFVDTKGLIWEQVAEKIKKIIVNRER